MVRGSVIDTTSPIQQKKNSVSTYYEMNKVLTNIINNYSYY